MMREIPRAGEALTIDDVRTLLVMAHQSRTPEESELLPGCVYVVTTEGPDRIGRSLGWVRGTSDALGVLDRLAPHVPAGWSVHALHADDVVTVDGGA